MCLFSAHGFYINFIDVIIISFQYKFLLIHDLKFNFVVHDVIQIYPCARYVVTLKLDPTPNKSPPPIF